MKIVFHIMVQYVHRYQKQESPSHVNVTGDKCIIKKWDYQFGKSRIAFFTCNLVNSPKKPKNNSVSFPFRHTNNITHKLKEREKEKNLNIFI